MKNNIEKQIEISKQKLDQAIKNLKEVASKFEKDDLFGSFHISMCQAGIEYSFKSYTKQDWEDYESETGNLRPRFNTKAKDPFSALVDQACKVQEHNTLNELKFGIWFVEDYAKGLKID